jgi:hypothetical protein
MVTSSNYLKNTLATICIAGTFLACDIAQAGWTVWNNLGGDGKWENAANWSGQMPDAVADAPIIGNLATAGPVLADTGTYTFGYMRVGIEASYAIGTLNVDGANLTCSGTSTRNGFGYGSGHIGILNISSGSLNMNNGSSTIIGDYYGHGTVNQTGGSLSFTGGGTGTICASIGIGGGTGIYKFYAGNLECRTALNLGSSGSATFHVYGYDAANSIQIGGTSADNDGGWLQGGGDTLSLHVDGGTSQGTTLIDVRASTSGDVSDRDGKATFNSTSKLDLDFNSKPKSGTWTVLSAEGGIIDSGLSLASGVDTDVWSFAIVGNDLQVTAVVIPQGTVISIQ